MSSQESMKVSDEAVLAIDKGIPDAIVPDIIEDIASIGVTQPKVRRFDSVYMCGEWMIPTAVVLVIGRKFLETWAEKIADDAYNLFKQGTSRIWARFFGEDAIKCSIIDATGRRETIRNNLFSIRLNVDPGCQVVLMFLKDLSPRDVEASVNELFRMFSAHAASHSITKLKRIMKAHGLHQCVLYINPLSKRLELIDYIKSGISKKLVGIPVSNGRWASPTFPGLRGSSILPAVAGERTSCFRL